VFEARAWSYGGSHGALAARTSLFPFFVHQVDQQAAVQGLHRNIKVLRDRERVPEYNRHSVVRQPKP
jgi:hypothetical protein